MTAQLTELYDKHTIEELVKLALPENPWFFSERRIDFQEWCCEIRSELNLPSATQILLAGSGATGFSFSPTKPGAVFRKLGDKNGPSDLDFCIVDHDIFTEVWDSILSERHDRTYTTNVNLHKRIFFGRVDERGLPSRVRRRMRQFTDTINRSEHTSAYKASIRIYRRFPDLAGYTRSGLIATRKELSQ